MVADAVADRSGDDDLLAGWCARMSGHRPRVALADGHDPRVVTAAAELAARGITPVVIGTRQEVTSAASVAGVRLMPDIVTMSPHELEAGAAGDVLDERLSTAPAERAAAWRADPLFAAVATVPAGLADACVAGSARPTADVLRAALRVVGTAPAASCVTSSFLMVLPGGRRLAYADCAVLPEPDREQLAEVAVATSTTYQALTGEESAVAMLSFSTKGSASHAGADLVRAATERVREREPGLDVDGELQFDAAFIESVGRSKAGASTVAGRANVFVFPNLAAGNIGYKITQRLAGAQAYGPILQGLAMPVNDLSRGCSSADIVTVAAISALQSSTPATRSADSPLPVTARTGRQ